MTALEVTPPPEMNAAPSPAAGTSRSPRPTQLRSPGAAGTLGSVLALAAGLAAWLVLFSVGLSSLIEHHDQSVLYAQLRQQIATQYAPVGAPIARGAPVAVISAPYLSRQVVVEGTDPATLRGGPGSYPGLVLPGQQGTASIFGRSTTYGAPFRSIHKMRVGQHIAVTTGEGSYTYRVVGTALAGQLKPTAYLSATSRLLLVTSQDSGLLGIPDPGRTQYVYAVLVGAPGAAGGVQTPSAADLPNGVSTAGLYPLVLWLLLLLVLALGSTWLMTRGPRRLRPQLWLLGIPIGLAALWGASSALFGVLPNLI